MKSLHDHFMRPGSVEIGLQQLGFTPLKIMEHNNLMPDPLAALKLGMQMDKIRHPEHPERPVTSVYGDKLYIVKGSQGIELTKKELFTILSDIIDFSESKHIRK